MGLESPDESIRSRIRWSRKKDFGLGVVSEDLKSGFDHGLGLTGARWTADEVGNRVTGSDDVRHGLPLDLVEILVVIEVEVGYGRRDVVFLLRPDPSSKDVVCRLEKQPGEPYLRSAFGICRDRGTHCILQITHIVRRSLELYLILSVSFEVHRYRRV